MHKTGSGARWAAAMTLAAMVGCADMLPPHVVTLMAADGSGLTGTATRTPSGRISVDLDNMLYAGTYVTTGGGAVGSAFGGGYSVSSIAANSTACSFRNATRSPSRVF